jgi:hypothetical protein
MPVRAGVIIALLFHAAANDINLPLIFPAEYCGPKEKAHSAMLAVYSVPAAGWDGGWRSSAHNKIPIWNKQVKIKRVLWRHMDRRNAAVQAE